NPLAVRRTGDTLDRPTARMENGSEFLSRRRVPKLDRAVPAPGHQGLAVGAENHTRHRPGVPRQGQQLAPGRQVPDLDLARLAGPPFPARGGETAAIGVEGQPVHHFLVAREREDLAAGCQLPDLDGPVLAGRGEAAAVRAEGHAPYRACVSSEGEQFG